VFDRSRERRGGTLAPSVPLGRVSAVCGAAPWGFTTADVLGALEDAVADAHGDHAITLRGVILGHPVTQGGSSVLPLRRGFRSEDPQPLPEDEMTLRLKLLNKAECMLRKRRADQADLKRCILRSLRHTTWCEFSARLF